MSSADTNKLRDDIKALAQAAGDDWGDNAVVQRVGDDWVAVMQWPDGTTDGGPSKLIIKPIGRMPVGGLSSTVLRQIDFRGAIEMFKEQATDSARLDRVDPEALRAFERSQLRAALAEGITSRYLSMLSFEYVRAADRGQANINDYLAGLVGKPVGTVRGHLIRARRDGLLSGAHGRKGGELSHEAYELAYPYMQAWLQERDRLAGDSTAEAETTEVELPALLKVVDEKAKPKRRRQKKAIAPRSET